MRIAVAAGRVELFPTNAVGRVSIQILDDSVVPAVAVDPTELVLTLTDRSGTAALTDTYGTPSSRIVRTAVGRYYFPLGDVTPNTETATAGDYLAYWRATVSGAQVTELEAVRVASPQFFWGLIGLKNYIDKSVKPLDPDCPLGYTDGQLALWLDAGLQWINAAQPYPIWSTVGDFPAEHLQTLIESAAIVGLTSQAIFAIDTDLPNYSDQGNAMVLDHHPRLEATLARIATRLDAYIPKMKLQYVQGGGLHVQLSPNFRIAMLANSAPSGALFRNLFPANL